MDFIYQRESNLDNENNIMIGISKRYIKLEKEKFIDGV